MMTMTMIATILLVLVLVAVPLALYAVHKLPPALRSIDHNGSARPATASRTRALPLPALATGIVPTPLARAPRAPLLAAWVCATLGRRALVVTCVSGILLAIALQLWIDATPSALTVAVVLMTICGAMTALVLYVATDPAPVADPILAAMSATSRPWRAARAGAAVVGLACAAWGAARTASAPWNAQWWWLAAMTIPALMLAASALLPRLGRGTDDTSGARPGRRPTVDWREGGALALVVGVALAFRLPMLLSSPPFVHGDEAACGLYGRLLNSGQAPLLSISWNQLPMLSYAICGTGLRLFQDTIVGLRLTNVILGTAGVVLTYALGRELFGRLPALLSGLVLAVTFVHVDLSRDGIHCIQGPTLLTLTLYLVVRWLRHGGPLTLFLAGVAVIFDQQVYWSARIALVLVPLLLLFVAAADRRLALARWRELPWLAAGLLTAGLPIIALFRAAPGSYNGRTDAVSIFSQDQYATAVTRGMYGAVGLIPVIVQQVWRDLTTFFGVGDTSFQIGWGGAMLDTAGAALLPAALILTLLHGRRWPYALILGWFGAIAAAGALTIQAPWWPRLAALLPAVALLLGVLLAACARFARDYLPAHAARWLAPTALGALLLPMAIGNARLVFHDYPAVASQASPMGVTLIGRFLDTTPDAGHTILLSDGGLFIGYDTMRFLAPHSGGCTLLPGQMPDQPSVQATCPFADQSQVYVILPPRAVDLPALRRLRPGGKVVDVGTWGYGSNHIIAYEAPPGR